VQTAVDFAPDPGVVQDDHIADIWVLAARGQLRLVIADPAHERVVIRTVLVEDPIRAGSLEPAAVALAEALVMVRAEAWPEPATPAPVAVAPPEPSKPVVAPARRAPGRFLRGLVVGISSGVAAANDEYGHRRLAVPGLFHVGWVFGRNPEIPNLRASIEASVGSVQVFEPVYDSLALWQLLAQSRIGSTLGPVWLYGVVGFGSGILSRRGPDESTRVEGGALATLGAGVGVRLSRRFALHVDGVASGNPVRVARLGLDVGLATYWDLPRKGRAR
jgi:hypothetical protein